jgi:hypothetical protein
MSAKRGTTMRRRAKTSWLVTAALGAIVALPSAAAAQGRDPGTVASAPAVPRPVGNDTVYLKDGGMVRGTIVDALPGAQVRIQLVTGEIDTLPWTEIDHLDRGNTAASPGPAAAPRYEVVLHVEAPPGVVVQQDVTNDDGWQTVCEAPCDKALSTAFNYRVTGGGIKSSSDFTLNSSLTHENLVVDGASTTAFVLGVVAMAGGVVIAYVGLIVTYAGELSGAFDSGNTSTQGTVSGGLTMMGVGALAAVTGLVVAVVNGKTKVTVPTDRQQGGTRVAPSWAGVPSSSPATAERRLLPPVAGIPLFSGRF